MICPRCGNEIVANNHPYIDQSFHQGLPYREVGRYCPFVKRERPHEDEIVITMKVEARPWHKRQRPDDTMDIPFPEE